MPPSSRSKVRRAKTPNKAILACVTCRSKKVKCSGTVPCEYCSKRGLDCSVPSHGQRRVYSVTHVEELQSRLERYERGLQSGGGSSDVVAEASTTGPPFPRSSNAGSPPTIQSTVPATSLLYAPSPLSTQAPLSASAGAPPSVSSLSAGASSPRDRRRRTPSTLPRTIIADSSLSSSNAFGSRVQGLIQGARPATPTRPQDPFAKSNTGCEAIPRLPSQEDAYRLLDTVNLFLGQTQSYFDLREFSDSLGMFYNNPDCLPSPSSPSFIHMVLVLALGKLMVGDFSDSPGPRASPGSELFDLAHSNLPSTSEQYSFGRIGVEILGLLAVYLQNVDRKVEAYIYISMALCLAVCHGYHKPILNQQMLPWERVHIGRLWWTIYMQERRLAAATGHPYGIGDDFIELDFPKDAPGFSPSAPIRTNARIARVTSRILWVLYRPRSNSQNDIVIDAKEIIGSLHDISKETPEDVATMVSRGSPDLSVRTTASLQLMLYQATLLTIRPFMLYVAQILLTSQKPSSEELKSSSLGQLSRTCTEAARRLLRVVIALRERNILAIFGFFDCDAIFSAAFVMILATIFDSACDEEDKMKPYPGLGEALESLQYLADKGNMFAIARLQEVQSIWSLLSEHYQLDNVIIPQPNRFSAVEEHIDLQGRRHSERADSTGNMYPGLIPHHNTGQLAPSVPEQDDTGFTKVAPLPPLTDLWADISQLCEGNSNPTDEAIPSNGIPSSLDKGFHNLLHGFDHRFDWDLVGHDIEDFAEFGRYIANFGP